MAKRNKQPRLLTTTKPKLTVREPRATVLVDSETGTPPTRAELQQLNFDEIDFDDFTFDAPPTLVVARTEEQVAADSSLPDR